MQILRLKYKTGEVYYMGDVDPKKIKTDLSKYKKDTSTSDKSVPLNQKELPLTSCNEGTDFGSGKRINENKGS